jgi:hypothetical protein
LTQKLSNIIITPNLHKKMTFLSNMYVST